MRQRRSSCAAGLDGETLATFGATRVQDSTAGTRSHASAETMGAFAANDRRLKSTFHRSLAKLFGAENRANPTLDRQQGRRWQYQ
jgi:hypothetical protein